MDPKTCLLLLGVSVLFVIDNVYSQKFNFTTPMKYERGCSLEEPDNLTVRGEVELSPEDFLMFQPKVIIQKSMELCTVDLLTCGENVTVTNETLCYCTRTTDDVYSFYARTQPGTEESGFVLQAVVPGRDNFRGLAGLIEVGEIPFKMDNIINVTATYRLNMGETKLLHPQETVQVCHGELVKLQICLSNMEAGERLTLAMDGQVTHTGKSCVEILKLFDFTSTSTYTARFSYSQTRRCPHPQAYTLTIQQCEAEKTTSEPTTAERTTEEPITEEPFTEEPTTEEPLTEEPFTEEPTTKEPLTEEPISEEPLTEEPLTEEPLTEEPFTEEPLTEEPLTEEQLTEEPLTEEPLTEEPTTEEPITEEPATDEPATKEPTTEEPSTTTIAPTTTEPITAANVCAMREGYEARQVAELNGKEVLCDTENEGGRWIVIQRRQTEEVDFYVGWHYYKAGFGNIRGNFWFGLDNIHELCNEESPCELRIDLESHGDHRNGTWKTFYIEDESENYRLHFNGSRASFSSDGMWYHDGAEFSTKDEDNDEGFMRDCANKYKGGWWYKGRECLRSNLNGPWGEMTYVPITSPYSSVTSSEMKVRPRNPAMQ